MSKDFTKVDLENIIKHLYMDYPLFGYVMIQIGREITYDVPTAAVTFNLITDEIVMVVNPKFMAPLSFQQRVGVVVHEIYHIIFDHLFRFSDELKDEKLRENANIAMDCAINQLILKVFKLPDNLVDLKFFKKYSGISDVNPEDTAEYYYKLLRNNSNNGNNGDVSDVSDVSDVIKKCDNHIPMDGISNKINKIVQDAINKQQKHELSRGIGSDDSLMRFLPQKEKCIDKKIWKKLVNKNFSITLSSSSEYVFNKRNRRNENSLYGKKKLLESSNVWVILDSSGSIDDCQLNTFLNQINAAMKSQNISCNLIVCDYEVKSVTMNLTKIKKDFKCTGRGGTDLTKATDFIKGQIGNKKTRAVILTDGYTDWNNNNNITTTAIYTKNHSIIDGIKYSAIMP